MSNISLIELNEVNKIWITYKEEESILRIKFLNLVNLHVI